MKTITVGEMLTSEQLKAAIWCYSMGGVKAVQKQVIEPNIQEINERLGQENDPAYLAFMVEYAVLRHQGGD